MKYSIEQGSISGYSFKNDTLNANFHFLLQANNPNSGFAIYYKAVNVSVSYEGTTLSDNSTVPTFHQPSRNITHVSFDLVAKDVRINRTVALDLNAEFESGDVALDLRLWSKMMMEFGGFRIHRGLTVHCKGLKVPFSSSKVFEKVACRKHVFD
ncbi:uncharacterized protein At1g08160-like [Primulina tabacum]|uniref:uncharacterized protein At1g08160-like n=1 Tax=Primulina tabacum TaxID=48773 RepID=UPI003F59B7BB